MSYSCAQKVVSQLGTTQMCAAYYYIVTRDMSPVPLNHPRRKSEKVQPNMPHHYYIAAALPFILTSKPTRIARWLRRKSISLSKRSWRCASART